jgi:hypothetical protein
VTAPDAADATFHASSSHEQRDAEALMLTRAGPLLGGAVLTPERVDLGGGRHVMVDGLSQDPLVAVEVYAHRGVLRGSQPRKVASDIMKLATVQRLVHPGARLAIVLNDQVVADQIHSGWIGAAAEAWGVNIVVVDLPDEVAAGIVAAQLRQTR